MRVVFFGTPEFATPPLRALIGEDHDVLAVVTQPDRPQGRSRSTLVPPPVKLVAQEEGIRVLQPERPRGEEFLDELRRMAPDLAVVVAYGHILTDDLISLPRLGTWNIHASLLPRWRGAAPIQASILAGDAESGVTITRMVRKLDAGPIVLQAPTPIAGDETAGELHVRLSELGALALIQALTLLAVGAAGERAQDESLATYAPKIDRENARIDWHSGAEHVGRMIRAFDPRPGAWTVHRSRDLKLYGVTPLRSVSAAAGVVKDIDEHGMLVGCDEGSVRVGYAHPSGGRRMAALDWHQGHGVEVGDLMGA